MNEQNGSGVSAARRVARNLGGLVHDTVTLAELQAELFRLDTRELARKLPSLIGLLAGALALGLGCVPIALACVASLFVEWAGWSYGPALLAAFLGGAAVSVALGWAGWVKLRQLWTVFSRSRGELERNLSWLKQQMVGKPTVRPKRTDAPL